MEWVVSQLVAGLQEECLLEVAPLAECLRGVYLLLLFQYHLLFRMWSLSWLLSQYRQCSLPPPEYLVEVEGVLCLGFPVHCLLEIAPVRHSIPE